MKSTPRTILALLLTHSLVLAQAERSPYEIAVEGIQKEIQSLKSANDANVKFFGNVQVDLKEKRIIIRACATGIKPAEPVEFFVATTDSGKDYESISIAPIKPSDLHHALESIGLKPGHPVDFPSNQYWSRGPRVAMTFTKENQTFRAEDLVLNLDTKKTLPHTGLLFTGSRKIKDAEKPEAYAADVVDARTLASIYNDPNTVLDLPDRTSQSGIYGFRKVIPDLNWAKGDRLTITLEPITDIVTHDLTIRASSGGSFMLGDQKLDNLPLLVQAISKLVDGKSDWFTTVSIDDQITIDQIRKLGAVLMSIEHDKGIKLNPPASGELYHRAFFPDETWRSRENRLAEPWELFLTHADGKWMAKLERQIENPDKQSAEKQVIQRFEPQTPEEMLKFVSEKKSQWTQAIFVYPPDEMTYGDLKNWLSPAMQIYPRIFVFPENKPQQ